jgi:hypothetical protein
MLDLDWRESCDINLISFEWFSGDVNLFPRCVTTIKNYSSLLK